MTIQSISSSSLINSITLGASENQQTSFANVISDAINKVNDTEVEANNKIESLIKGEDISMHDVMLSMQEAQISMQALIEVRNKVVEAYQEISKLQL